MTTTLTLPDKYGYVLLSCVVAPTVVVKLMSFSVGSARGKYDVKVPNLYGVPGYHKEADAFNRVQRGHQNVLTESYPFFMVASLLAGVRYPRVMTGAGVTWCVGAYLYQLGYSDEKLDVSNARYAKGGMLYRVGNAAAFIGLAAMTVDMLGLKNYFKK